MAETDSILAEHLIDGKVPESVAIVAMGPTISSYVIASMNAGGRGMVDEVWAVNLAAGVIQHDRMFHMDDLHVQRARAEARPDTSVGRSMAWIPTHDKPIYTSRQYDDFPASVEFPLEWVVNKTGADYYNGSVPYALTLAIAIGVKRVHLYGCDYTYEDDLLKCERGRACLEWWMGYCALAGVTIVLPPDTTLLDSATNVKGKHLYGYDTEIVYFEEVDGRLKLHREDRDPEQVPTADEMEVRYNNKIGAKQ